MTKPPIATSIHFDGGSGCVCTTVRVGCGTILAVTLAVSGGVLEELLAAGVTGAGVDVLGVSTTLVQLLKLIILVDDVPCGVFSSF